jgi:hypothetical protein
MILREGEMKKKIEERYAYCMVPCKYILVGNGNLNLLSPHIRLTAE